MNILELAASAGEFRIYDTHFDEQSSSSHTQVCVCVTVVVKRAVKDRRTYQINHAIHRSGKINISISACCELGVLSVPQKQCQIVDILSLENRMTTTML